MSKYEQVVQEVEMIVPEHVKLTKENVYALAVRIGEHIDATAPLCAAAESILNVMFPDWHWSLQVTGPDAIEFRAHLADHSDDRDVLVLVNYVPDGDPFESLRLPASSERGH